MPKTYMLVESWSLMAREGMSAFLELHPPEVGRTPIWHAAMVEQLRQYGPIACQEWAGLTVSILAVSPPATMPGLVA